MRVTNRRLPLRRDEAGLQHDPKGIARLLDVELQGDLSSLKHEKHHFGIVSQYLDL